MEITVNEKSREAGRKCVSDWFAMLARYQNGFDLYMNSISTEELNARLASAREATPDFTPSYTRLNEKFPQFADL
jgi:hypothetical protein